MNVPSAEPLAHAADSESAGDSIADDLVIDRLRRRPWPTLPVTFRGQLEPTGTANLPVADVIRAGLVAARRFTCALSHERFDTFMSSERASSRTVVIHALDPALSVPLLLYWTLANVDRLSALATRVREELRCDVVIALPADMPAAYRDALRPLGQIRLLPARYPAGSWQMMPIAMGIPPEQLLTLDAVAAVDLALACGRNATPLERPIGFETDGQPRLAIVTRGTPLSDLTTEAIWSTGAPLASHHVESHFLIGDGELAFHRVAPPTSLATATTCVRCGACVTICPTRVDPVALLDAASTRNARKARHGGVASCIECGLCTAACPSMIPLHVVIAGLRRSIALGHAKEPRS